MSDLAVHICDACGKPMGAVPTEHREGATSISYECEDFACPAGPGGLMTVRMVQKDTGEVVLRTKLWGDGSFHDMAKRRPSQNESNVGPVAKAFIAAANREFELDYDAFELASKSSQDQAGHDCVIVSGRGGYRLKLQVTRALPSETYRKQAKQGKRSVADTTVGAASWIVKAIQDKESRAAPCIALVIDGMDVPAFGIFADAEVVVRHSKTLDVQNWHSMWVIGHFGLRHLGGQCVPRYDG